MVSIVERCCINRIDDGVSRRRGVAEYRRRTRDDGHAQCGGAVCCRGGIDGRPDKGLDFDLHPGDGFVEDGGG